jgi:hypothetical protein
MPKPTLMNPRTSLAIATSPFLGVALKHVSQAARYQTRAKVIEPTEAAASSAQENTG